MLSKSLQIVKLTTHLPMDPIRQWRVAQIWKWIKISLIWLKYHQELWNLFLKRMMMKQVNKYLYIDNLVTDKLIQYSNQDSFKRTLMILISKLIYKLPNNKRRDGQNTSIKWLIKLRMNLVHLNKNLFQLKKWHLSKCFYLKISSHLMHSRSKTRGS